MSFTNAVQNQISRTENNMKAHQSSSNALVDLFYNIGASRGKDIIPKFVSAYVQDKNLATRIVLWARDVRNGAGERKLFHDILQYLEVHDPQLTSNILHKIPEIGRWDDIFVFKTEELKSKAYQMLGDALRAKNGLAAKWTPRQGPIAVELRKFFNMTPKFYRKSLVELTNVVETKMCAKDWDNINFSNVPSVAHARYKKAFNRNTTKYVEYVTSLVKGVDSVKVNAGAVYPYDVIKGLSRHTFEYDKTEMDLIIKQWESLPNFVGNRNILPMVDVSGSMSEPVIGNSSVYCLDVAISLGLYCADKNTGLFNGTFLTFSGKPALINLKGNIVQKYQQMVTSDWGMNTDLVAALSLICDVAKKGNVSQDDMPKTLLIFSDMQFDMCVNFDDSAMDSVKREFINSGFEVPQVVFWNLRSTNNIPVKAHENGVALVSGFSPSIMTSVLNAKKGSFNPESIMMDTILNPKYDFGCK